MTSGSPRDERPVAMGVIMSLSRSTKCHRPHLPAYLAPRDLFRVSGLHLGLHASSLLTIAAVLDRKWRGPSPSARALLA